jgi:hypothetical protein
VMLALPLLLLTIECVFLTRGLRGSILAPPRDGSGDGANVDRRRNDDRELRSFEAL